MAECFGLVLLVFPFFIVTGHEKRIMSNTLYITACLYLEKEFKIKQNFNDRKDKLYLYTHC